ncbi:ROK family transcriptional regulator [uncultured Sphaerochaeta sp.]|uniref:ROK family transcriptional regulator n=1 Tax=uncultured Sphaerochaeta sp. TaxID=886478 RepID=UPI002A0A8CA5|nr:ROK family transcriptional regulator [uncultured Sphaerochaeta sp.]
MVTSNKVNLQEMNLQKILKVIVEERIVSRADIAKKTNITPATVSTLVQILIDRKIAKMGNFASSTGGRRAVSIEIDNGSLYCLGVTVKKRMVTSAIVSLAGDVIARQENLYPVPSTTEKILGTLVSSIDALLEIAEQKKLKIIGIGVGVHGVVDYQNGISVFAPAFQWKNIHIKKLLEEKYSYPILVDNDVRVMVLAEKYLGKYRQLENFIFLSLDSGVGGGILINGKVLRGVSSAAGEIGHIRVQEQGYKCVCGNYGCLETVASEVGLVRCALDEIKLGYPTLITEYIENDDLSNVNFEVIYRAALANDALALRILQKMGDYVGNALADIVNMFNPEMIIIGGKISLAWDLFKDEIRKTVISQSMTECNEDVLIVKSSFDGAAGEIGAAALVISDLFEKSLFND